jgi:hypothetical protein
VCGTEAPLDMAPKRPGQPVTAPESPARQGARSTSSSGRPKRQLRRVSGVPARRVPEAPARQGARSTSSSRRPKGQLARPPEGPARQGARRARSSWRPKGPLVMAPEGPARRGARRARSSWRPKGQLVMALDAPGHPPFRAVAQRLGRGTPAGTGGTSITLVAQVVDRVWDAPGGVRPAGHLSRSRSSAGLDTLVARGQHTREVAAHPVDGQCDRRRGCASAPDWLCRPTRRSGRARGADPPPPPRRWYIREPATPPRAGSPPTPADHGPLDRPDTSGRIRHTRRTRPNRSNATHPVEHNTPQPNATHKVELRQTPPSSPNQPSAAHPAELPTTRTPAPRP